MTTDSLQGRSALVTGAAIRIGRRVATRLAEAGMRIAVHYRSSGPEAASLVEEIESRGGFARSYQADFESPGAVEALAERVLADFGECDLLVNNASIWPRQRIDAVEGLDFDRVVGVNLRGPFLLSVAIGRAMKRRGQGAIVNIIDWSFERPYADQIPYAVSKAGLAAATRGLARALAPEVRVNAIAPGPVLLPEGAEPELIQAILRTVPLRRMGDPDDIAEAVLYLARAAYVTGTILNVDGGRSLV